MGPAVVPILIATTAVSAYSAYQGAQAAKKSARAQQEAAAQTGAQNEVDAADARRRALREARIERAQIAASGIGSGTTGSSADIGAAGQSAATAADTSGDISGSLLTSQNISSQNQIAAAAQARQQKFAAIGNFASGVRSLTMQTPGAGQEINNFFS